MENKALLFDIQKYCVHDGPGIRTNIFFKGCALRCLWCANPESQSRKPNMFFNPKICIGCGHCAEVCPNGAFEISEGRMTFDRSKCTECGLCAEACHANARKMYGREYTVQEIIDIAERDIDFYITSGGGITFSGGEPALWPDQVREIADYFRAKDVSTCIETCGYAPWENYSQILPSIDIILYDFKIWDEEKHIKYCGASNDLIKSNLEKITAQREVTIRIPIIPGVNDSEKELLQMSDYFKSLGSIKKIHVLAYHNMATAKYDGLGRPYPLPDIVPPEDEHMEWVRSVFMRGGFEVKIGG